MRRNKFDEKRKNNLIKKYSIILIISISLAILFVFVYRLNKQKGVLDITETANTNYKVYLKDNKFYKQDYVEENKQYVEKLIKNIKVDYNYNLNSNSKKESNYTYRIEAILDICDAGTKKSLYTYTQNLLKDNKITSNDGKISINEEITIDYQYFNNIANKFINTYSLSPNNKSELKVNLVIKPDYMDQTVLTVLVPLTKNTFDIVTSNKLASNQAKPIIDVKENKGLKTISIIMIVISLLVFVCNAYKLITFLLDSRTDEEKYKSSVKRILANYGGYINKTDDFIFNLDDYEIIRVNTFVDLLKIKEDLSRPVLMIENKEKTNVMFAITDNSNFIYMYALNMHQKKLAEKNEQSQDHEPINV